MTMLKDIPQAIRLIEAHGRMCKCVPSQQAWDLVYALSREACKYSKKKRRPECACPSCTASLFVRAY